MDKTETHDICLVVTDMDKTLLNDSGRISEKNIEIIKKLKRNNIRFAIASGRARPGLYRMLDQYQIKEHVDYIISMNGVSIYDTRSEESHEFDYLDRATIISIYNKYKDYALAFAVHKGNTLICSERTVYTDIESEINGYDVQIEKDFAGALGENYPKLMLIGEEAVIDAVSGQLADEKTGAFNFFKSYNFFLEIVNSAVSKGNALVRLCDLKDIDILKVLAIGDNLNDLDMIKSSGFGVAVLNSHEEVKRHARFLSKSNNEDGFAHACMTLVRSLSE